MIHRTDGISIMEILLASAIFVILVAVGSRFLPKYFQFGLRRQVTQQLNNDARTTLDSIGMQLRRAKPESLRICTRGAYACSSTTPATPANTPPKSRIEFTDADTGNIRTYVYWSAGNIYMEQSSSGFNPRLLGSNVSLLKFSSEPNDPSVVAITLRMDRPVDAQGGSDRLATVLLSNQLINLQLPR